MNDGPDARDVVAAFAAAASRRRKPLLVVDDTPITYGTVLDRVARLTRLFLQRGWKSGDRIAVASHDAGALLTLHLALLRNGITSIVVDPGATEREVSALVGIAAPSAVFADAEIAAAWRGAGATEVIEIGADGSAKQSLFRKLMRDRAAAPATYPQLADALEPAAPPERIDPESIAYILFTSGSTAAPKGVCISHRALFAHLATLRRQFSYDEGTRLLNVLPLHHTDGMNHGPLTAFACGGTSYRVQRFTLHQLGELLDRIYKDRITHLIAVPTLLAMMAQTGPELSDSFATEDFRFVVSSAAPLVPSLWEEFEARFRTRVVNVYGLTETVVGGLFCGPGDADFRIGTVGRAIDCEARIVDAEGRELADGSTGELEMRGDNLLSGYYGDERATAAAFHDGWFRTGDLAVREDGFYRIAGRRKNLIISGGYNIQPEEVTEVLVAMPDVVEAVTLGVADETFGERVVACVSIAENSGVDGAAIIGWCRRHLTPAKVPSEVYIVPLLPKGASGKIDSQQVRLLIEARAAVPGDAADVNDRVLALAARVFAAPVETLGPDCGPHDTPGWDSFAHLQFVVALEHSFGVRLSTRDVLRIATLGDAQAILAEKLG